MAKKGSALGSLTRKVASRKRKRAAARRNPDDGGSSAAKDNPPFWEDAVDLVLPGVVAYAGGRISGRIAYAAGARKSTGWAKHLGALTPTLWFLGTWFAVHKVEALRKYHNGVVIGGAIAASQAILQTYMPQWGWILNDYHMQHVPQVANGSKPAANGTSASNGQVAQGDAQAYAEQLDDGDDMSDIMGNDEIDDLDDLYTGSFARH